MKITATAATPYSVVVSTPVELADPSAVDVTVTVAPPPVAVDVAVTVTAGPPPTVVVTVGPAAVLVIVLVVVDGTFWRFSATMSPGTAVPHVTRPAVIGTMTCIGPLAVAPMDGRTLRGPPM